jgi:hypothetical protein
VRLLGRGGLDRSLYFAQIRDVDEWPDELPEPRPHFVVLLAMDATSTNDESIASLATKLISQGMVELHAWGPECNRIHDIFDRVEADRGVWTDDAFVSTSWYEDEDLDDAMWGAVYAVPTDAYIDTCRAVVAIVVDHPEWGERVETAFADFEAFDDAVLAREPSECFD